MRSVLRMLLPPSQEHSRLHPEANKVRGTIGWMLLFLSFKLKLYWYGKSGVSKNTSSMGQLGSIVVCHSDLCLRH